jgi:hypothetical protein
VTTSRAPLIEAHRALCDAALVFRVAQKRLDELRTADERGEAPHTDRLCAPMGLGAVLPRMGAAGSRVSPSSGDLANAEHQFHVAQRALNRAAQIYADARASAEAADAILEREPEAHGVRRRG